MSSMDKRNAHLQPHHLFNLRLILRNANQRYQAAAESIRRSLRPTHHARNRAAALGLKVDIHKAVRCPQKQVSIIPLPVIDTAPSPTLARVSQVPACPDLEYPSCAVPERPVIPPIVIPALMSERRQGRVIRPRNTDAKVESRREVIPTVSRGRNTSQVLTSRFSITPDDPLFHIHLYDGAKTRKRATPDVPVDPVGSWETSYLNNEVAAKLQDCRMSPSDSSSSSQASAGPDTPDDMPPIMIRIKRKSIEVEDFHEYETAEKRLKYVRKDWVRTVRQDYF